MITKTLVKSFVAVAAFALWIGIGQAQATTYNLDLTGQVSSGWYSTQDWNGTHYDVWTLQLSGLDMSNAITVAQGDRINATISLDQTFTIPASVSLTWFDLSLRGSQFPNVDTGTNDGQTSFFNNGSLVTSAGTGQSTTTSGGLEYAVTFSPPDNGAITFNSVTTEFAIEMLSGTGSLDTAYIDYYLFSPSSPVAPVPEPSTFLLLGLGFAGVGFLRKRIRK